VYKTLAALLGFVCILYIASQSSDSFVRNVPNVVRAEIIQPMNMIIFWDFSSCSVVVCTGVSEEAAAFIMIILFAEVAGSLSETLVQRRY
jgi:hypothetical protein